MSDTGQALRVRSFNSNVDYQTSFHAMQTFTEARHKDTADELWLLQHDAVYTQGQAGKAEHLLEADSTPVVQSDRGGQITWHGPGQLVGYLLCDIKRKHLNIKQVVDLIEQCLINLLEETGIHAFRRDGAPGVYTNINNTEAKIAALGLRVRRGCTYHGLALNIDNDLQPFSAINPCGYPGLVVTSIRNNLGSNTPDRDEIRRKLVAEFARLFNYHDINMTDEGAGFFR
jgi:lipoyl(octanoyl) transferase